MRLGVLAIGLWGCGFAIQPAGGEDPDGGPTATWPDGFAHRRPLAITSGADGPLDDFVVAVTIGPDAALAASARDDGRDLMFVGEDGRSVLDFEIERFDGATGELAAWVRFASLPPTTTAYLYYGHDAVPSGLPEPTSVWAPAVFEGVWHLTDASADLARDSTAGAHHLQPPDAGRRPAAIAGAIVGGGRGYDGSDDTLRVADDDHFDHGTSSFSYGVWVRVTQSAGPFDMPMYKGGASAGNAGYDLELGTGGWTAYISDGTDVEGVSFGSESQLLGAWVHLVAVVDREAQLLRAYRDGVERATTDIAHLGATDSAHPLDAGTNTTGNYPFRGELDEPRVYARALSPAWIAAEHANLSDPAAFVVVGAEQARP